MLVARWATVLVGLGVAVILPLILRAYDDELWTGIIILALMILSVNLVGLSGQVTVGQGAFAGLGAYATAILVATYKVPHILAFVIATLICLGVGLAAGVPALRIKGLYLVLVTLSMAVVFPTVLDSLTSFTGGSTGLSAPAFTSPIHGLRQDRWAGYLTLVIGGCVCLLVHNLIRGRVGRALVCTRDNEIAAQVLGVDVGRYKIMTFGIGAMIAGLAGSLLVLTNPFPYLSPTTFALGYSILLLVGSVVGGTESVLIGPLIGAAFISRGTNFLESLGLNALLTPVIFGGIMILILVVAPSGIVGVYNRIKVTVLRRVKREALTA